MKTKCYCLGCKNHPLHSKRNEYQWLVGWSPDKMVFSHPYGTEVDCLDPVSDAFDIFWEDPEDFEYPITAYGDGCAITGFQENGITLVAFCKNEDHEN